MEEKKLNLEINVTCKDEATAKRYAELTLKMVNDKEFLEKAKSIKNMNMQELYDTYKAYGYTDMDIDSFAKELGSELCQVGLLNPTEIQELSENDLDKVAGGGFWGWLCNAADVVVSAIPILGPIATGVAKAVIAGVQGKGACAVLLAAAKGVGCALCDAALMIGTGGVSGYAKIAITLGMGMIKGGISMATE